MKNYYKIIGCIIITLATTNYLNGQNLQLEMAKSMGGPDSDYGYSIKVDQYKNIYTTGYFRDTVDFDPNAGVVNLASAGNYDIFIQKLDPQGNLLWAKSVGGLDAEIGNSIAVDGAGNIYVTGSFRGTTDFDPGPGVYNLSPVGTTDIFILKLDYQGNFIWAWGMGSTIFGVGYNIIVDDVGNVYSTGRYYGTVDFDPSPSVFNLTSSGQGEIYLHKLDPQGNLVWAKSMGGGFTDAGLTIAVDNSGSVYTSGHFGAIADFDPGPGIYNLTAVGSSGDVFVQKLDAQGDFVWAKSFGGNGSETGNSIEVDNSGNVYIAGTFYETADFDPGPGISNVTAAGNFSDIFIEKLDAQGNFVWVKTIGGTSSDEALSLALDDFGNIYTTGYYKATVDFDPNFGTTNLTAIGSNDIFIQKLNSQGDFVWAHSFGGTSFERVNYITIDEDGDLYTTGSFSSAGAFDPNSGTTTLTANGNTDAFIQKLSQGKVSGVIYHDFNQNCIKDSLDNGLNGRNLIITPGNIVVTTSSSGYWGLDSLPAGVYNITLDTSGGWIATCPNPTSFTVVHSDSFTVVSPLGVYATNSCPSPNISIHSPFLRPGFSNQKVYVQACNLINSLGAIDSAFVIVELDPLITVQSASLPYTSLGNNEYQVYIADFIYPGYCVNFWLSTTLSTSALLGQTLCMKAQLYPVDSCVLDSIPNPYPLGQVSPCSLPWDFSSLMVEGSCVGDSVRFVIYNTGDSINGDMNCSAPVRVYLDGQFILLDSIQLVGGDSIVFMFYGNGQTWRLESNQHPLHPGNSHPNATIENCGSGNWTPGLVNILPQDDADSFIDIYCGEVTASYDPNDKTGFPLGVGTTHDILPNQKIEYLIRFQNTGTDTAFNIVVRDTLSMDFDIFSVKSGVSSHDYIFNMHGPRVLEWIFPNIMLLDSNTNESLSHGFVKFEVEQMPNLSLGTIISNSAAIYFDFNSPIITNSYHHTLEQHINTVVVETNESRIEDVLVRVYPNPFTQQTTFEIHGKDYDNLQLWVYDIAGKLVAQHHTSFSNSIQFSRGNLVSGVYLYQLRGNKQLLNGGKIIVK